MGMRRVRVRRQRPSAAALAVALCVTMLVVYVLTLGLEGPEAVEDVAVAARVTREIGFEALEGWCVRMAACETSQAARVEAAKWVGRGAAGYVAELDGAWAVLGAVYDSRREAERVAQRLASEAGVPAEVVRLRAEPVRLRVTGPEAQIDAIAGADAMLRSQAERLGGLALQVDRNEITPDAVRALCALAASEATRAGEALSGIPGSDGNALCAGLVDCLAALRDGLRAIADGDQSGAALSALLRCAQLECFVGQAEHYRRLAGRG